MGLDGAATAGGVLPERRGHEYAAQILAEIILPFYAELHARRLTA